MPRPTPAETRRKKRYGRCRICNKFTRLTKEHVPPRKALNDQPHIVHSVDRDSNSNRLLKSSREENTAGIYVFSLCEDCNNKTGRRYGHAYIHFVETISPFAVPKNVNTEVPIHIPKLFPLRVVKQVTSMMLSTSNPTGFQNHEVVSAPGVAKEALRGIELKYPTKERQSELYENLRTFVGKRDKTFLPDGVRLYVFASVGRRLGFRTGIFTRINLKTKSVAWAAITGLYPVHWVFTLDSQLDEDVLEVTDWAKYEYGQCVNLEIQMPMRWLEGHYPLDFRSPDALYANNFINSMKLEGFVPSAKLSKQGEFEEALYFARKLGRITKEGYLISNFETGVFYEFENLNGWLEGATVEEALKFLEWRRQNELEQ